jgi:hypothetical protein
MKVLAGVVVSFVLLLLLVIGTSGRVQNLFLELLGLNFVFGVILILFFFKRGTLS